MIMNTEPDSDMVLREPAANYMVEPKSVTIKPAEKRVETQTKLCAGQSVVEDIEEFTTGLLRVFGEAKDKAIQENKQLAAGK